MRAQEQKHQAKTKKPGSEKSGEISPLEQSTVWLEATGEESEANIQFLLFQSSRGVYGLNILQAHEVLKPVRVTRLPNVADDVLGVINLRGSIIPVLDINKKFGYDFSSLSEFSRIVVCTFADKMMGLLVDRVLEVARIAEEDIEAAEVSDLSEQYISGVGRSGSRIFLILNPSAIFVSAREAFN